MVPNKAYFLLPSPFFSFQSVCVCVGGVMFFECLIVYKNAFIRIASHSVIVSQTLGYCYQPHFTDEKVES